MQIHTWCLLFVALVAHCCSFINGEYQFAQAGDLHNEYPSSASLCGENLVKETGVLNGLYYVFYESSSVKHDAPVILWLSGGPGCSGLVALLFENGPCSFDDEADTISFNPYSWTGLAHMIYLDQPKGTGYSKGDTRGMNPWSLGGAADDMRAFLQEFYLQHPKLKTNDFYIFGESYAGHYVPDLAVKLLNPDKSLPTLKGIAIGNGVVSTKSWVESVLPFFRSDEYGYNFLESNGENIRTIRDRFVSTLAKCRGRYNLRHLPSDGPNSDCAEALRSLGEIEGATASSVWGLGRNVYDVRRECHDDDPLRLCYRFSRLQTFVNSPRASTYFDDFHEWALCSLDAISELAAMDKLEESESNVARALEHGVRVLVYGGDADTVVNWLSQDSWTRDLTWKHQNAFASASFDEHQFQNRPIGRVRSSHGLSFMKIYNAGHMVPHDQPAVSYEIVRSFLYDAPDVGMFS
ncbi:Serine protease [Phytophthora megakarya]|uniref:Carboxypeptidase n=1 Tax=Phytophthora megakarya TaxID=4795 RepID=A0A225VN32_9STRA|nr:Serine protease [Phytophthora megakarya]